MSLALVQTSSLDDTVKAIQAKLVAADESEGKSTRYRIQAGQMLLTLRKRIEEDKEAGDNVKWWPWYRSKFGRGRKDAEKIMKLARAEDPAAAHDEEKARKAAGMRRSRATAHVGGSQRLHGESQVAFILRLVDELSDNERDEFLAAIEERYS